MIVGTTNPLTLRCPSHDRYAALFCSYSDSCYVICALSGTGSVIDESLNVVLWFLEEVPLEKNCCGHQSRSRKIAHPDGRLNPPQFIVTLLLRSSLDLSQSSAVCWFRLSPSPSPPSLAVPYRRCGKQMVPLYWLIVGYYCGSTSGVSDDDRFDRTVNCYLLWRRIAMAWRSDWRPANNLLDNDAFISYPRRRVNIT